MAVAAATSNAHKVTEKELPQYADYIISKFDPRSFTFANTALLKMKNKIDADIMTDGWPEFSCTVMKLPLSEVIVMNFFLSESQESLESFSIPKVDEHSIIGALDQKTSSHLKSALSLDFVRNLVFNYKVFYFPGTIKDLPMWSCPQGTFTAKLKADHAGFISESWEYLKPWDRLQYFKYLIENCFSIGLFLEVDTSQPVSWALLSNFGHITHVYTVEEHRRKGYSRVTMLCLMEQILEADMIPMLDTEENNTPMIKLNNGLGFVETFDSAWIYTIKKI